MKRKDNKKIMKLVETFQGSFYLTKNEHLGRCTGGECNDCVFCAGEGILSCMEKRLEWLNEEIFDTSKYVQAMVDIFVEDECDNDCDNCPFQSQNLYTSCDEFLTEVLEKGLEAMGY